MSSSLFHVNGTYLKIVSLTMYLLTDSLFAAVPPCSPVVGRMASIDGVVEIQRTMGSNWTSATLDTVLCQGDTVRSGARSRAALTLINETVLRLDQRTSIRLIDIVEEKEKRSLLGLLVGAIQSFNRKPRQLEVDTPYLNGVIEGTEFVFRVENKQTLLTVFEGTVTAANEHGRVKVPRGESVVAAEGEPPTARTVVRPRDAAQWTLYYPPVLAVVGGQDDNRFAELPASIREALRSAGQGNINEAFAALDRIPNADRRSQFFLTRAALLLSVGRLDEAWPDVNQVVSTDPQNGQALALRATIHVTQNNRTQALVDAKQAVALSPRSAAAMIALSYAQQANFEIVAARDTLLQAAGQQPDDPLVLARLAELWLMLGYRGRAVETAQQAASLAPELGRTQITLGFAALAEFRIEQAAVAFERAIRLTSADPLPHLGLGLSKIATGDIKAGREEIAIAVGLDSNNALLRAYLGKAYFEEKRSPLDADQFAIAKELDPLEPTPYLYSGIAKQTVNRPIAALRDVQDSIALNDNRAAYRGRLLLDQDQAARGTSLARIYKDLGFSQLSIIQSTKSLALDPTNASAHRFLSDSYRDVRRREISRVSELFQAQLMQDININPVQPSLSETNLNIVTLGGAGNPGFNEFTPLFQRNKAQFNATGFAGNNNTFGGEAVVSGVFDRYSFSAGAFTFDSDGFRNNYDLTHNIYNVYGQAAITPAVNIQAELRRRESENGDLSLAFDPNNFFADLRRKFEDNSARIGLRFSPDPSSNLLLSFIYSDREENGQVTQALAFPDGTIEDLVNTSQAKEDAYQAEGQYILRGERFNVNAGAAYTRVDQDRKLEQSLVGILDFPTVTDHPEINNYRVYAYGNVTFPAPVTWTLGLSYQKYDEETIDVSKVNPKLGVQWDVTDSLRVRASYFRVVKSALAANRTLEPTQVAGFNQFFDDANATQSDFYGTALNWQVNHNFHLGGETTWREFEQPLVIDAETSFEDRDEWFHRAFLYWTPNEYWSLSAEAVYDRYTSENDSFNPNLPREVETLSFPFKVQFFNPNGLFGGLGVTYVDQKVRRSEDSLLAGGKSDFTVFDLTAGYRFPRRLGIASVSVQNLFDNDFNYQDDSFRVFQDEPSTGPYIPERRIMVRITLNY